MPELDHPLILIPHPEDLGERVATFPDQHPVQKQVLHTDFLSFFPEEAKHLSLVTNTLSSVPAEIRTPANDAMDRGITQT